MKQEFQKRVSNIESDLTGLSDELQQLNKRVEDAQLQWNDIVALHANKSEPKLKLEQEDTITYQNAFDHERHSALLRSTFSSSNKTQEEIFSEVNLAVYQQMQCDKGLSNGSLADTLFEYRRVLEKIVSENPDLKFVTAYELSRADKNNKTSYCQIRHDVDADIVACLPMAKIEAELGIKSTYFLLHSASYFGEWKIDQNNGEATFFRNEELAQYYLQLQELGHEVAIHTDPLHLYQNLNIDGARALVADIEWLRSIGLKIRGTAPHNNPSEYGAANSAIFKQRPISRFQKSGAMGVLKNNKWAPLAQLDETELDLLYEADDIHVFNQKLNLDYLSPTTKDKWWRLFKTPEITDLLNQQTGPNHPFSKLDFFINELPDIYSTKADFWYTSERVPTTISQGNPKIIILAVHPEHFGFREHKNASPSF